jgi:hypothetical protein
MVHIYPWETTRAAQWSVQRQLNSQKHVD